MINKKTTERSLSYNFQSIVGLTATIILAGCNTSTQSNKTPQATGSATKEVAQSASNRAVSPSNTPINRPLTMKEVDGVRLPYQPIQFSIGNAPHEDYVSKSQNSTIRSLNEEAKDKKVNIIGIAKIRGVARTDNSHHIVIDTNALVINDRNQLESFTYNILCTTYDPKILNYKDGDKISLTGNFFTYATGRMYVQQCKVN
jgi:hypothetical protein